MELLQFERKNVKFLESTYVKYGDVMNIECTIGLIKIRKKNAQDSALSPFGLSYI